MQGSFSAMRIAGLFGIFVLIHVTFCIPNDELDLESSDYENDKDDNHEPAPGSLGKYFVYVNCTTCKVKSELQVKAKGANEEGETEKSRKHPVPPGGVRKQKGRKPIGFEEYEEYDENWRTVQFTHYPAYPKSRERGKGRKGYYGREEGEREKPGEAQEKKSKMVRMKATETTTTLTSTEGTSTETAGTGTTLATTEATESTGTEETGATGTEETGTTGTEETGATGTEETGTESSFSVITGAELTSGETKNTHHTEAVTHEHTHEHSSEGANTEEASTAARVGKKKHHKHE